MSQLDFFDFLPDGEKYKPIKSTDEDEEEAWITAWKTFPEYKELGVFEQGESDT